MQNCNIKKKLYLLNRLAYNVSACTDVSDKVVTKCGARPSREIFVLNVERAVLMEGNQRNSLFGFLYESDLQNCCK